VLVSSARPILKKRNGVIHSIPAHGLSMQPRWARPNPNNRVQHETTTYGISQRAVNYHCE
jgi:hypothetical protein